MRFPQIAGRVDRQASFLAFIDVFWTLMLLGLAVVPLALALRSTSSARRRPRLNCRFVFHGESAPASSEPKQPGENAGAMGTINDLCAGRRLFDAEGGASYCQLASL
jgi:hypothetical protein